MDTTLPINREHFQKLRQLYDRACPSEPDLFLVRLFCLLQRYDSLGNPGLQVSVPATVFTTLQDEFGVRHECFASPLNQALSSYHSAFPDTDRFFGSRGDFFDLSSNEWAQGGSYQAYPPFTEECMQMMSETVHHILEHNDKTGTATSFMVVVPCWTDERAHEMMRESRFLRKHIVLEKAQHTYCSGSQHAVLQQHRHHEAGYRTTVFFLQNDSGASEWPVTTQAIEKLEQAFRGPQGSRVMPSGDGGGSRQHTLKRQRVNQ